MLPFLFTTLKRRLGTEDTKWWSVSGVILSHSSCKQVLRWATVRGLRCRILRFKMCHTFSIGDRPGLQAGQSSTRTLFLRSQDFAMCAECGFALSCWNMHGRPWKRCLLEGSILCSKISMYFSALMVPSQKCKLPLPRALTRHVHKSLRSKSKSSLKSLRSKSSLKSLRSSLSQVSSL